MTDADIFAAVYVKTVPVGIYFHVQNAQIVYSCSQQTEMTAMQQREVFQCHVLAEFQADGFIAYTGQTAFLTGESFAINQSRSADGDVFQTDSPDK